MLKRITLSLGLIVFLAVFLFPEFVSAHNFFNIDRGLVFITDLNSYRLRSTAKPWQLSALASADIIESFKYNDEIFIIANEPNSLFRSTDGLSFQTVGEVNSGSLSFLQSETDLFIFEDNSNKLFRFNGNNFSSIQPG